MYKERERECEIGRTGRGGGGAKGKRGMARMRDRGERGNGRRVEVDCELLAHK